MSDHPGNRPAARPPQVHRGAIQHRQLLDAIAASVPFDRLPEVETATVTRLLRAVPWYDRGDLVSLVATYYPALAVRAARYIGQRCPSARVVSRARRPDRENRVRFEVLVPAAELSVLTGWLRERWAVAAARVTARNRQDDRLAAARTMWRAALLVSSSDRRRAQVRIRVPDAEVLHTLADAGEALELRVTEHRCQSDYHFLTVDDPAHAIRLLRAVGAGGHAEAWVARR
ncbi:hypothetical protein [Dactylosporangium sp. CA-092794]|uniref:hypothetical protein n=1 Tax=Dactylosporangium sp. CA-092794 TaxID=3239929 RepID=UPI003D8D26A7